MAELSQQTKASALDKACVCLCEHAKALGSVSAHLELPPMMSSCSMPKSAHALLCFQLQATSQQLMCMAGAVQPKRCSSDLCRPAACTNGPFNGSMLKPAHALPCSQLQALISINSNSNLILLQMRGR